MRAKAHKDLERLLAKHVVDYRRSKTSAGKIELHFKDIDMSVTLEVVADFGCFHKGKSFPPAIHVKIFAGGGMVNSQVVVKEENKIRLAEVHRFESDILRTTNRREDHNRQLAGVRILEGLRSGADDNTLTFEVVESIWIDS